MNIELTGPMPSSSPAGLLTFRYQLVAILTSFGYSQRPFTLLSMLPVLQKEGIEMLFAGILLRPPRLSDSLGDS